MSYEKATFDDLGLPSKEKVSEALICTLLQHKGTVKEFGSGNQEISDQIADYLGLTEKQRAHRMQTYVTKEERVKTFPAWHRLLFRAGDYAAHMGLVTRPNTTIKLTNRREWMLTENGIDLALKLSGKPVSLKESLPISTYELVRTKRILEISKRPAHYSPVDVSKQKLKTTRMSLLRTRGFRLAVIEAYNYKCSVCGLILPSPDFLNWEVEAAHIVPHSFLGKDDIWNGIALCRFHHWAFDVGWFTLRTDFTIEASNRLVSLPQDHGKMKIFDVMRQTVKTGETISLPSREDLHPHEMSILWHRANVYSNARSVIKKRIVG